MANKLLSLKNGHHVAVDKIELITLYNRGGQRHFMIQFSDKSALKVSEYSDSGKEQIAYARVAEYVKFMEFSLPSDNERN